MCNAAAAAAVIVFAEQRASGLAHYYMGNMQHMDTYDCPLSAVQLRLRK